MFRKSIALPVVALLVLNLTGCAATGLLKFSKDHTPKTGPKNPVIRIVGMWQVAEGLWEGKTTRGFSGQILFFGQDGDIPAEVDGDVLIYEFDDQGSADDQVKPIRQFAYPAKSWKALLSKGPLGVMYNVFVPYTRPGIHEAKCTLRIRYTPANGVPVYSEMVHVQLPGAKKTKPATGTAAEVGTPEARVDARDGKGMSSASDVSNREPPRARGMAQAIPLAHELQEQQRPQPVELTEKEQRRILRETRAGRQPEIAGTVSLAGYEEPGPEVPPERVAAGRRSLSPVRFTDDAADVSADDDAVEASGSLPPSTAADGFDSSDQNDGHPAEGEVSLSSDRSSDADGGETEENEPPRQKRHPLEDE